MKNFVGNFIKGMATAIAIALFKKHRKSSMDLLKIQIATYYLKAIQTIRLTFLSGIAGWFCVFLFAFGLLILHLGFFLLLYINFGWGVVAAVACVLGILYVCIAICVLRFISSEKQWMATFQADSFIKDITKK
jgi:hypothetical protein